MPKPKKTESPTDYATAIVNGAKEEIGLLLGRNWPDIQTMLDDKEEISISIKLDISDRKATPGEQAGKDNRIKATISFAKKFSDSVEIPLPDPAQIEMNLDKPKEE